MEDGSCHARSVPTGSQRGPVKSLRQTKPLLSAHSGKKLSFYILTSPPTLSPWLALLSHTGSFSLFLKHLRQVPPQGLWACRSLVLECSPATCPQLPPSLPLGLSHTSDNKLMITTKTPRLHFIFPLAPDSSSLLDHQCQEAGIFILCLLSCGITEPNTVPGTRQDRIQHKCSE